MNRWTKISGLGAVAATVLAVGSLATFAPPTGARAPAAGAARDAGAADPNYVYIGGTSIARSGDGVVSGSGAWTVISPPTPDSPQSLPGAVPPNEINPDPFYVNEYGAVTQIAPAKTTGTPACTGRAAA